jgi:hypothetical protein
MSGRDMELNLTHCSLVDNAAGAFVECLQRDGGPILLKRCGIKCQILASALTGGSRVSKLQLDGCLVRGPSPQQGSGHFGLARPRRKQR